MNKILDNYKCEGQTDIFDFLKQPKGYFKCDTCVYYQCLQWRRKADEPLKMTCVRAQDPLKDFNPVIECEEYMPNSRHFKCCETCEYGNCFCEDNCWLVDKEKQDTPNRHHREGFPAYGKDYHDLHEWDICDKYKQKNKNVELL